MRLARWLTLLALRLTSAITSTLSCRRSLRSDHRPAGIDLTPACGYSADASHRDRGRWNQISDDDKSLLPLFECLTSISQALGAGFTPFAPPVFSRCLSLIERTLSSEASAARNGEDVPDKEFVVCALDLISGMTEGMGEAIAPLMQNASPRSGACMTYNFTAVLSWMLLRSCASVARCFQGLYCARCITRPLVFVVCRRLQSALLVCMRDAVPDVRQSAYALVGDLAKACIDQLRPRLGEYLLVLSVQLDPAYISVCNNASWAIGEIAMKVRSNAIG